MEVIQVYSLNLHRHKGRIHRNEGYIQSVQWQGYDQANGSLEQKPGNYESNFFGKLFYFISHTLAPDNYEILDDLL